MAKGCSMPFSLSARTISGRMPRLAKVVSDAARFGAISGVMREARTPFGVVFDRSIVAVTRAPVDCRIRCRFAGALLLLRRANCVHAHCLGNGGTDLPPLPGLIVAGGPPRPGLAGLGG